MSKRTKQMLIPIPTAKQVEDEMRKFSKGVAVYDDLALNLAFGEHPKNIDRAEVLLKVVSLNWLYNTRIMNVRPVVDRILALNLDAALQKADPKIIDKLKVIKFKTRTINMYSFASKYCSFHRPNDYPIYDRYVDMALRYFRSADQRIKFANDDLRDYSSYKRIVLEFAELYGLTKAKGFCLKALDKYLLSVGKTLEFLRRQQMEVR